MKPSSKVNLGSVPLIYPIPVVLVGANVAGQPNYEAVGNCAIGGFNPGLVYISSVRSHYTNQGIVENGTFSVNIPTTEMVAVTDFCGMASGREFDKGTLFESFYGQLGTAPMIAACPVNLECQVLHEYSYGEMQMFIGLIVGTHVDQQLAKWMPDPRPEAPPGAGRWRFARAPMGELRPITFHHDNLYYGIGEVVGRGYHDGKSITAPRRDREGEQG